MHPADSRSPAVVAAEVEDRLDGLAGRLLGAGHVLAAGARLFRAASLQADAVADGTGSPTAAAGALREAQLWALSLPPSTERAGIMAALVEMMPEPATPR